MGLLGSISWTWLALALAFLLGAIVARRLSSRFGLKKKQTVNKEYFKGLNFLLDEETDKAIDVFIKALEVDSETVELHLALGGLFRRKGQVDRATRIHQNLIARPSLSDDQRQQAVHELANDYYKAGWLDRAENLFLELKESIAYKSLAINGLCKIYQQEKEWQKAIDVLKLHKRSELSAVSTQLAHYHCELAEVAIKQKDFSTAHTHLRFARAEKPDMPRSLLLRGDLSFAEGAYEQARELWQRLANSHPQLAELIVAKVIRSFQAEGDTVGLQAYVLHVSAIPKDAAAFSLWQASLYDLIGEGSAIEHIVQRSRGEDLSAPLANFLFNNIENGKLSAEHELGLLKQLLGRIKQHKVEYTCIGCGFDTKAMYWFCPNCGQWESFR